MILVDANLLIYAVNSDLVSHQRAHHWWQMTLSGSEPVGIPWIVALAFLRLTTNPRVFATPLDLKRALDYVDAWVAQPMVELVAPGPNHWNILRNLLEGSGTGGNLTNDAHIAALALEQGYDVYSADHDFRRFSGLKHVNPLE